MKFWWSEFSLNTFWQIKLSHNHMCINHFYLMHTKFSYHNQCVKITCDKSIAVYVWNFWAGVLKGYVRVPFFAKFILNIQNHNCSSWCSQYTWSFYICLVVVSCVKAHIKASVLLIVSHFQAHVLCKVEATTTFSCGFSPQGRITNHHGKVKEFLLEQEVHKSDVINFVWEKTGVMGLVKLGLKEDMQSCQMKIWLF